MIFSMLDIDAINRPDRPIPSGAVSRAAARGYAVTLFLAGILVSFFTNPLCIAIAVFNSLLLIAYAARLKRTPLTREYCGGLPFGKHVLIRRSIKRH